MATRTYTLGGHEFVLERPSLQSWGLYADSGDNPAVLFLECIKSPDSETLARIFARRPAYKHTLRNLLGQMAGADLPRVKLEPDPDKPDLLRYQIGERVVAFRSATEAEYDDTRDIMRAGRLSDGAGRIVSSCLKEPDGVTFAAWCEETPALRMIVGRLILEEAGMFEAALEKK